MRSLRFESHAVRTWCAGNPASSNLCLPLGGSGRNQFQRPRCPPRPWKKSKPAMRDAFAFCSFNNLFVWLQGVEDRGRWTQFDPGDYVLPY